MKKYTITVIFNDSTDFNIKLKNEGFNKDEILGLFSFINTEVKETILRNSESDVKNNISIAYKNCLNDSVLNKLYTPIEDLGLSNRAYNCLESGRINYNRQNRFKSDFKIKTLADIVKLSREDLLSIKNSGEKTVYEIEEMVKKMGFTLEMDLENIK